MAERRGSHVTGTTPVLEIRQNTYAPMYAPVQEKSMLTVDSVVNAGNLYGSTPFLDTQQCHAHTAANYFASSDPHLSTSGLPGNMISVTANLVRPVQQDPQKQQELQHQYQLQSQQVAPMHQHQEATHHNAVANAPNQNHQNLQQQQEERQQYTELTPGLPGGGALMCGLGTLQNLAVANNNHANCTCEKVGHAKRPMSAFMLWSRVMRKQVVQENPKMHYIKISKRLRTLWNSISEEQKRSYIDEARRLRERRKTKHLICKFCRRPKKQNWLKRNENPLDAVSLSVGNNSQRSAVTEAFAVQSAKSDTHCSVQNRYVPNGSTMPDNSVSHQQYHHVSCGGHTSAAGGYSPQDSSLCLPNTTTPYSSVNGSSYGLYTTEGDVPVEGPSPCYISQQQPQQLSSHMPWQLPSGTSSIHEPASKSSEGFHVTTPVAVTTLSGVGGCEGGVPVKCELGNDAPDADESLEHRKAIQRIVDFLKAPLEPDSFLYLLKHHHASYSGHTAAAEGNWLYESNQTLPDKTTLHSTITGSSYDSYNIGGEIPGGGTSPYLIKQQTQELGSQMLSQIPCGTIIESETISQPSVGPHTTTPATVTRISGAGGYESGISMKCEYGNGVQEMNEKYNGILDKDTDETLDMIMEIIANDETTGQKQQEGL